MSLKELFCYSTQKVCAKRFNPYSFGCVAESVILLFDVSPCNQFQSLFFWMCRWKITRRWNIFQTRMVSILILLDVSLKVPCKIYGFDWKGSFNPYSFGCVAEREFLFLNSKPIDLFQSLFFWMCRWKISDTRFEHNHLSFNPYSFGCVAERILIRSNENFKINEFQSLFFWMCRWKHLAYQFFFFHLLVSILILLDVSLKGSREIALSGMFRVSILILLDVSLKVTVKWITIKTCFHVSILILLDVSLKDLSNLSLIKTFKSFNPYSFGCVAERLH